MLLGIDTCGATGTVALARFDDGSVSLIAQKELAGKTYSVQLVPKVRELLEEQGLDPHGLKAVVVVGGPGSFTGVRIGMSSAKAFAEALKIPLLAVSRLAVLAHKSGADAAVLDAGRGEFYFRARAEEALLHPEEVSALIEGSLAVCDENAAQAFPGAMQIDPPTAADALLFAAPRVLAEDFDDPATLDGNYLRRSDAEIFAKRSVQAAVDATE
jgi:tRNA threonylcarbamoyladenosine biosynthesis protein TsaB